jgi:hypothetical protein
MASQYMLITIIVVILFAARSLQTSMLLGKYFQQISDGGPPVHGLATRSEFPAHMHPERHQAIWLDMHKYSSYDPSASQMVGLCNL